MSYGVRRPCSWLTALALDGFKECGLFSTNVCARTRMQMHMKIEICVENMIAEEPIFLCLFDGMLQTSVGKTIFTADINVSFIGTEGVAGDCHGFQNGM